MKFLYVDTYIHHKNKIGFLLMCKARNIECVISKNIHDFSKDWDLVFLPSEYAPPQYFPNAKAIMYGPQNFVFVNGPWLKGNSSFAPHCFYNLLSDWVIDVQNEMGGLALEAKSIPFAVDVDTFSPKDTLKEYDCFVYFKQRHSSELAFVEEKLKGLNLNYIVLKYGSYKEEDYMNILHKSKFGIWIGRHESQGFAVEECLSCNIPLLVWDCKSMFEEYSHDRSIYDEYKGNKEFKATAIPYWDETCGLSFTEKEAFPFLLEKMLSEYLTFTPRNYILKRLSPEACIENLLKEIRMNT